MAQPVTPGAKVYILSYHAYGDAAHFQNRLHIAKMDGLIGVYSSREAAKTVAQNYLVDYLQKELDAFWPPLRSPEAVRDMKESWATTEGWAGDVWWYDYDGDDRGMNTTVKEWVVQ
ncbi:hypothetical protein G7Y79_00025g057960 [Physcia stellaris]|nr:hypothetical protein G7Y79_00025g057960 [Physcia stellaris]